MCWGFEVSADVGEFKPAATCRPVVALFLILFWCGSFAAHAESVSPSLDKYRGCRLVAADPELQVAVLGCADAQRTLRIGAEAIRPGVQLIEVRSSDVLLSISDVDGQVLLTVEIGQALPPLAASLSAATSPQVVEKPFVQAVEINQDSRK